MLALEERDGRRESARTALRWKTCRESGAVELRLVLLSLGAAHSPRLGHGFALRLRPNRGQPEEPYHFFCWATEAEASLFDQRHWHLRELRHFCGNRTEDSTSQRTQTSGPHHDLISLNFPRDLVDRFSDGTECRAGFEIYLCLAAEANSVTKCFF